MLRFNSLFAARIDDLSECRIERRRVRKEGFDWGVEGEVVDWMKGIDDGGDSLLLEELLPRAALFVVLFGCFFGL